MCISQETGPTISENFSLLLEYRIIVQAGQRNRLRLNFTFKSGYFLSSTKLRDDLVGN